MKIALFKIKFLSLYESVLPNLAKIVNIKRNAKFCIVQCEFILQRTKKGKQKSLKAALFEHVN